MTLINQLSFHYFTISTLLNFPPPDLPALCNPEPDWGQCRYNSGVELKLASARRLTGGVMVGRTACHSHCAAARPPLKRRLLPSSISLRTRNSAWQLLGPITVGWQRGRLATAAPRCISRLTRGNISLCDDPDLCLRGFTYPRVKTEHAKPHLLSYHCLCSLAENETGLSWSSVKWTPAKLASI